MFIFRQVHKTNYNDLSQRMYCSENISKLIFTGSKLKDMLPTLQNKVVM